MSDKAPYLVTLLVALITWVATQYFDYARSVGYLGISMQNIAADDPHGYDVVISNLSKYVAIEDLSISVRCSELKCFERQGSGEYAKENVIPPQQIKYEAIYQTGELNFSKITLPPFGKFGFSFKTAADVKTVYPLFSVGNSKPVAKIESCSIRSSFDCYLSNYFLSVMFWFWLVASIIVGILLLVKRA